MSKAKFCKCKNTYTNKDCNFDKKCKSPEYWRQGIGSLTGNGISNVINNSSEVVISTDAGSLPVEEGDSTVNSNVIIRNTSNSRG